MVRFETKEEPLVYQNYVTNGQQLSKPLPATATTNEEKSEKIAGTLRSKNHSRSQHPSISSHAFCAANFQEVSTSHELVPE
jgi:hypothetical protein